MLTFLLALSAPVTAVALLYARGEYRKRGQLSILEVALLCAMLLIPNLSWAISLEQKPAVRGLFFILARICAQ